MTTLSGTPVLILKEGAQRAIGKDAQRTNILAARVVAEAVRSTLGPKGMDKMLVDSLGDVTITNDGVTILKEMEIQHPAAKMLVEAAEAQDDEVGDGTTTVTVLAGELLKQAEELIGQNIHPTVICEGYRAAALKAQEVLNKIAEPVTIDDENTLEKVAVTAMSSKLVEAFSGHLATLAVKAVKQVAEKENNKYRVDIDHIKVEKKEGESLVDTQLIQGIVIDKEVVHPRMPKRVENAKIALLDCALEIKKTEVDAQIRITSPEQLKAFLEEEERMLKEKVDKIKASGANVVFCQKGIDDLAQHYLAKYGILAVRRIKESDMEKLSRATGANIVTNLEDLNAKDFGFAGLVEERKIAGEEMTFIENCKNPKSVSILIRGGTKHVVEEAERSVHDAICVVAKAVEDGKTLAGGGASDVEVAKALKEYAQKVGGRQQLAIEAFANTMETIPKTLAENAGLDPIDIIVELRAKHEKDGKWYGIDVLDGKVKNMLSEGVIEPLRVKQQAIKSASEAAVMILRIDDVIAASKPKEELGKGPKGMPETPETESEFD